MIDDGFVFGEVDDRHRNELGAEGQHVEFRFAGFVLLEHVGWWDGLGRKGNWHWLISRVHAIL